jgi:hypothetical protein
MYLYRYFKFVTKRRRQDQDYIASMIGRLMNMEWELTGEIELLVENLPQGRLSSANSIRRDMRRNSGRRCQKPATNAPVY